MGMCLAFSIEELRARDFAFDGTVTAINGTQATFAVNDGLWGVADGTSIMAADLMVGDRRSSPSRVARCSSSASAT